MATRYRLIGGTAEDVTKFEKVLKTIPWEEYPSGVCGHKDREQARFTNVGFKQHSFEKGMYGVAAVATFTV